MRSSPGSLTSSNDNEGNDASSTDFEAAFHLRVTGGLFAYYFAFGHRPAAGGHIFVNG